MSMAVTDRESREYFGTRVVPSFKQSLRELAGLLSQKMGTRITQAQALEIVVADAVKKMTGEGESEKK